MRTHALIWAVLVAAAVGVLFHTSHQAEELEAELEARHRAVLAEREAIRVLRAEWAYLNEPGRLRELARQYTPLGPAMPIQIVADPGDVPAVLPGLDGQPGIIIPPRKPVRPTIQSTPGVVTTVPAETGQPAERPMPASDGTLQALLADFRAQRFSSQGGASQ